ERSRVVLVAEDAERVVLLRIDARRDDDAVAETVALRRILPDAELGRVDRVAVVVIVEAQLVDVAASGLAEVVDVAVLDVAGLHQLLEIALRLAFGRRGL